MNTITLTAVVVSPGELKEISTDSKVRTIRLAHSLGKDKDSLFVDVEVFGGWAENFRGTKGDLVVIQGELRQSHYKTMDGEKRSRMYLRGKEIRLLEKRKDSQEESPSEEFNQAVS